MGNIEINPVSTGPLQVTPQPPADTVSTNWYIDEVTSEAQIQTQAADTRTQQIRTVSTQQNNNLQATTEVQTFSVGAGNNNPESGGTY